MSTYQITPYGPLAWLVSATDHSWIYHLGKFLDHHPPSHFIEWTIGDQNILLIFDQAISREAIDTLLAKFRPSPDPNPTQTLYTISVDYDGPDLQEIATLSALSPEEVISCHTAPLYTVRFLGFAPGFAYLDGLDPLLILPRRSEPRAHVSTGAVAIGGPYTGIYTVPSPGGWHWIGNTSHLLFDSSSGEITLKPGDTIRFIQKDA